MEIIRKNEDLNLLLNTETDFQTNLGWEESLEEFETEVLSDIINPVENYETVRYIHEPYSGCGINQTDLWFYFYFLSGGTYVQDYSPQDITPRENERMLKQATESFFRLEFYKTPGTVSGTTLTCEPPTRQNRKLIFAKNLSLPLGEKYFYNTLNGYIHVPVFRGSNYSNKENMYLFWFADESVLTETNISGTTTLDKYTLVNTGSTTHKLTYLNNLGVKTNLTLSGSTTGTTTQVFTGATNQNFYIRDVTTSYDRNYVHGTNTFFMTAKFYNAKDGSITDFANNLFSTAHEIVEKSDMYYQVDIDKVDYSYKIYQYSGGTKGSRVGTSCTTGNTITPIKFFEKGGGSLYAATTPTPTPSPTPASTPTASLGITPTPTPTPTAYKYFLLLDRCDAEPGTITGWTLNSYSQSQIMIGDIFASSTYFYQVINYNLVSQGGSIEGSLNTSGFTSCDETPGHYVTPVPLYTQITLVRGGSNTFNNLTYAKEQLCGNNPSYAFNYIYGAVSGGTILDKYITYEASGLTPSTIYTVYNTLNRTVGDEFNGGDYKYGVMIPLSGGTITHIVEVSPSGVLQNWSSCV
jgi:hypothetical protein